MEAKGFVAGCSNYPECKASWWLPKSLRTVDLAPSTCVRCSQAVGSKGVVHKLAVTTIRSLVPPSVPPEDTACPCCSSLWEDLRHAPLQVPKTPAAANRAAAGGAAGRGRGGGGRGVGQACWC